MEAGRALGECLRGGGGGAKYFLFGPEMPTKLHKSAILRTFWRSFWNRRKPHHRTLLRRVLRRFYNRKCFLEGFLEGAL